jgi:hypothetical protein
MTQPPEQGFGGRRLDDPRDVATEERVTGVAALMRNVDPEPLLVMARERAGGGPVVNVDQRDLAQEALEEAADGRNYCVWRLAQLPPGALDQARERFVNAVGHFVAAFEEIRAGEALASASEAPPVRPMRARLDAAIRETALRWPECRCNLHARMTDHDLMALGCGCTGPRWACPRLDAVRRRVVARSVRQDDAA